MAEESIAYSIVVRGNMNPAIHHPSWYREVALLDEDAAALALQSASLICGATGSRFETATMAVQCLQDNWTIETGRKDSINDMVELASNLFDKMLPHTPVQAVGLNVHAHVKARSDDVERALASLAPLSQLGIDWFSATGAGFSIVETSADRRIGIQIEPSVQIMGFLFIGVGFGYPIKKPKESLQSSDIGPILQSGCLDILKVADRLILSVVDALNKT